MLCNSLQLIKMLAHLLLVTKLTAKYKSILTLRSQVKWTAFNTQSISPILQGEMLPEPSESNASQQMLDISTEALADSHGLDDIMIESSNLSFIDHPPFCDSPFKAAGGHGTLNTMSTYHSNISSFPLHYGSFSHQAGEEETPPKPLANPTGPPAIESRNLEDYPTFMGPPIASPTPFIVHQHHTVPQSPESPGSQLPLQTMQAHHDAPSAGPGEPLSGEGTAPPEEAIQGCRCGDVEDVNSDLVQCYKCKHWSHMACQRSGYAGGSKQHFVCHLCHPATRSTRTGSMYVSHRKAIQTSMS